MHNLTLYGLEVGDTFTLAGVPDNTLYKVVPAKPFRSGYRRCRLVGGGDDLSFYLPGSTLVDPHKLIREYSHSTDPSETHRDKLTPEDVTKINLLRSHLCKVSRAFPETPSVVGALARCDNMLKEFMERCSVTNPEIHELQKKLPLEEIQTVPFGSLVIPEDLMIQGDPDIYLLVGFNTDEDYLIRAVSTKNEDVMSPDERAYIVVESESYFEIR